MNEQPRGEQPDFDISYSRFNIQNDSAYATRIAPYSNAEPDVPILFSPGLRNTSEMIFPILETFAQNGRQAIGVEHVKHIEKMPHPTTQYPNMQIVKAATLYEVAKLAETEQVDLVGYCEGAVNGTIFARAHPEMVRNFVLINPAGMSGKDNLLGLGSVLAARSLKDIVVTVPHILLGKTNEEDRERLHMSRERILGGLTARHLARVSIANDLLELERQNIRVSILQSYRDNLYRYDVTLRHIPEGVSAHASLANKHLGHAALITDTPGTVAAILGMLQV